MHRFRAVLAAIIAAVALHSPARAAVDPPAATPAFLSLPYRPADGITTLHAWYYTQGRNGFDGRQNFCNYQHDIPRGNNHCSMDFVKRTSSGRFVGFLVLASANGMARRQSCSGCGTYLQIDHSVLVAGGAVEKWCSRYLHLNKDRAIVIGPVRRGQPIATAGDTGTDVIHLHWDVRPGSCSRWQNNQVDPFDIAGPLLRRGIAPTKEHYPGGSRFAGCGPNHLMLEGCQAPAELPSVLRESTVTGSNSI